MSSPLYVLLEAMLPLLVSLDHPLPSSTISEHLAINLNWAVQMAAAINNKSQRTDLPCFIMIRLIVS